MDVPLPTINSWWRRLWAHREVQLKYGAFILLFVSLVFSMFEGPIFSFGWIAMGVMGLLLVYRMLERYFFMVLWLIGIYFLLLIGALITFHYASSSNNWFLLILGISMLVGSFMATVYLVLFTKEIRDDIALEGEYVPIGLWTVAVFTFFWSSLFAMLGFIKWADGSMGTPALYKALYFIAELLVIPLLIYIPSFPDMRFKTVYVQEGQDKGLIKNILDNLSGARIARIRKRDAALGIFLCPICDKTLSREVRKCPSCDTPRFFYWCDRSEEFFIRCPNCRELTPVGRERCIECAIRMSNKIRCSRCRDVHPVSEWVSS